MNITTMQNVLDPDIMRRMARLQLIWKYLYTVLSSSIILLNILVVVIYLAMGKRRRKIPNYLLFIQASVDIFYGVKIVLDVLPAYDMRHLVREDSYNAVKTFLGDMLTYIAVGTLIMTSGERYIALHKPLYHLQAVTRFKVMICFFVLIFLAAIPASVFAIINDASNPNFFNNLYFAFYVFDNVFIICGVMFVITLFILTYRTIHKSFKSKISTAKSNVQMQNIQNQQQQQQELTSGKRSRGRQINALRSEQQRNARVIRLFLTIATLYILMYLPTCIFTIYTKNGGGKSLGYIGLLEIQVYLFALHTSPAAFNPILTLQLKDDYRYPIKFCKKKWRQFVSRIIKSKPIISRSRFFINGTRKTGDSPATIHQMRKSQTTSSLL